MRPGRTLLAAGLVCGLISQDSQASLTPETVNGISLVYNSGSNTTWTQDANLLASLENNNGYSVMVNAIIAASNGVIHDTANNYDNGNYVLTAADFGSNGKVDWWAGQAFMHYLNTQNYGGSHLWALPSQPDESYDYYVTNSQLGELFYTELGGTAGNIMPSGPFANVQPYVYWSGLEYAAFPSIAWDFITLNGDQYNTSKINQLYVWPVSPGSIAAVPELNLNWLFMLGILVLSSPCLKNAHSAGFQLGMFVPNLLPSNKANKTKP
ncbi:DUF1566 domain-containing protein [Methylomonas paludis]|uniref:DUF1566 domain-containing protein n=1 Tax=Methylomonas paludis TaxID=1173101 RepID=A0A975R9Z6_9GAMM|nr:DUF1566 domain-containing protein [Methylomonas paludis]QWF71945.1 DUF1566 domain-containing protein [Methylomonas paludis]